MISRLSYLWWVLSVIRELFRDIDQNTYFHGQNRKTTNPIKNHRKEDRNNNRADNVATDAINKNSKQNRE